MKAFWRSLALCASLAFAVSGSVIAEETAGQTEYYKNCAVCHGVTGGGDGPFADFLKEKPKSLTTISERNGGMFPVKKMYGIITGTEGVQQHGSLQMPVWGDRYMVEAITDPDPYMYGPYGSPKHYEEAVQGRIFSLIMFLADIQE